MNTTHSIRRFLALVGIAVALAAVSGCQVIRPGTTDLEPDYWPTDGWRNSTPEAQGFHSDKLADLLLAIREQNVQIHSLLVIRNGYVVLDATFYPYDGQSVHNVASVTKSLMTTLIGIAADQGKLNLDDKMVSFFPDRSIANLDQLKADITVRHLASMTSGLDCTGEADEQTLREMVASPDFVQFVLDRKVAGERPRTRRAVHLRPPAVGYARGHDRRRLRDG